MAVKYSGLLKFTDEIKAEINLAADGTVEKAVVIDGDGVETPIGGSTSDYTTATVSFTNNLTHTVEFAAANIVSDNMIPAILVEASTTETVTVLLYNGYAECDVITPLGQNVEVTATGSISPQGKRVIDITGNGTITVAATE